MRKIYLTIIIILSFLVSCSSNEIYYSDNKTNLNSHNAAIEFLSKKYADYLEIEQRLRNSSGSGKDVKTAYDDAKILIEEIEAEVVPSHLYQAQSYLIEGISMRSDGYGCFSNKSICGSDLEALQLIKSGLSKLDQFIEIINEIER